MERLNQWLTLFTNLGVIVGIVFLAIEIQQSTDNLELNRKIALTEMYATRNNTVQDVQVQAALSSDFAEIYVKWERDGIKSLTEAELFRVRSWEIARLFRVESQYIMQEQGFLDKRLNLKGGIIRLSAGGWRELDIIWMANGGFREVLEETLREIDEQK